MSSAQSQEAQRRRQDRFAVVAPLLIGIVILAIICAPAWRGRTGGGGYPIIMRQADLRSLSTSINNYSIDHNDRVPPVDTWAETLADYLGSRDDPHLGPDAIRDKYFFVPAVAHSDSIWDVQDPENDIMLYEHPALMDGTTNVAFWDGSVQRVSDNELEQLLTESDACLGYRYRPHEGVTP